MKKRIILISVCLGIFYTNILAQTEIRSKTLYNGIVLPKIWPPPNGVSKTRHSMPVPYLETPPSLIPINVGRQLFVDDFLIESTNLTSISHIPQYSIHNPVLEPDKEWEFNKNGPYAAPFSDGGWFDEKDNKFKMWYLTGAGPDQKGLRTGYAESIDGINWEKPDLGIFGNTNIVDNTSRDASTIWLDKSERDSTKRYKMFMVHATKDNLFPMILKYSSDGKHWSKAVAESGGMLDRSTVFYNPFLSKWILSMKAKSPIGRSRDYLEQKDEKDLVSLAHKVLDSVQDANIVFWFGADSLEPRNPSFPDIQPQIYNHDAIAYESIMLGFFVVWQGPENNVCEKLGIQKRNEVLVGYSRDGFHWSRPSHKPFMGVNPTEGAWNWGNVQSVIGTPIIKGDSLYFYVSGRRLSKYSWDSYSSTGLATLRRDGFVSMNTNGDGYLITRNIVFTGNYFFVNADVKGELKVELEDAEGKVISGYSKQDCIPMKINSTKYLISWKNNKSVSKLINKKIKIKFYLNNADLYSFWVSKWTTGESNGYTAGGGPGLNASGIDKK
jgi:hypothetical protein